jgi:hypothetical protein
MNTLFLDGIEPRDETYRFIRDDPRGAEAKAFIRRLWTFFFPYADHDFRKEIANSFSAKFWEMYLAFGLANQGAKLEQISSRSQGRRPRHGPDFRLSGLSHPVWIEATVPLDGTRADRVPEEHLGSDQDIPSESLILRYRTRIDEKFKKLRSYLEAGIVHDSDPYIIAINSRSLSFGLYESDPPRILHALFPLGDQFVTIDPRTKQVVESGYQYRAKIVKQSGEPVSTDVFLDPTYEGISAVLFCPSDVWHRPPNEAEVGLGDFMLIHNPMAKNKVPYQWLKCGRECWVENNQLVIKKGEAYAHVNHGLLAQ